MALQHGFLAPHMRGYPIAAMSKGRVTWAPRDLGSSLVAWWSADFAGLMSFSGASVTSWKDVVGGYDLVQGTSGARPAYSATAFNGRPAVDFDGSDDQVTLTGVPASFPIDDDPCEIWAILDNESAGADTGTRRVFNYGGNSNNTSRAMILAGITGTQRLGGYVGTGAAATFSTNPNVDAAGRHACRLIVSATGISAAIDGGSPTTPQSAVPATTSTMVRAGLGTSGAGAFNGKIRDIAVTLPLTGDDLAAMWAWAQAQRNA